MFTLMHDKGNKATFEWLPGPSVNTPIVRIIAYDAGTGVLTDEIKTPSYARKIWRMFVLDGWNRVS